MEAQNNTPKRRRGRPNQTPAGRDQLAELAHLRAWWHANKADLPPLGRLATRAGVRPDYARLVVTKLTLATATLDKLYVVLEKFGYQPLVPAQQQA